MIGIEHTDETVSAGTASEDTASEDTASDGPQAQDPHQDPALGETVVPQDQAPAHEALPDLAKGREAAGNDVLSVLSGRRFVIDAVKQGYRTAKAAVAPLLEAPQEGDVPFPTQDDALSAALADLTPEQKSAIMAGDRPPFSFSIVPVTSLKRLERLFSQDAPLQMKPHVRSALEKKRGEQGSAKTDAITGWKWSFAQKDRILEKCQEGDIVDKSLPKRISGFNKKLPNGMKSMNLDTQLVLMIEAILNGEPLDVILKPEQIDNPIPPDVPPYEKLLGTIVAEGIFLSNNQEGYDAHGSYPYGLVAVFRPHSKQPALEICVDRPGLVKARQRAQVSGIIPRPQTAELQDDIEY